MGPLDLRRMLLFSAILRLALIVYGEWQDAHMEVRYTDIDYFVFSDAADLVSNGKSPFERSTYRYSPLLAFLLVPNSLVHRSWGKLLFSSADLLVGFFVDAVLKLRGVPENLCLWSVAAWLFNPFTLTIGTRGNCEPLVSATILWIMLCLMNGARCFKQHFVISKANAGPSGRPALQRWDPKLKKPLKSSGPKVSKPSIWLLLWGFITKERILFGLLSGSVFFFWTSLFFCLYGWDFLNEALLYHLTRTDPRHNFSIYFYHIYLHHQQGFSVLEKLISFLPQIMVQLAVVFRFFEDIPFCLFVQTVAFVAFNKVITAQYFVWFFCLLPLILPWSSMKFKWNGLICILVWMGSQVHWLMWGYLLEFKGQNVFLQLWLASLLFLAANSCVLVMIIKHHRYSPTFKSLADSSSADAIKTK